MAWSAALFSITRVDAEHIQIVIRATHTDGRTFDRTLNENNIDDATLKVRAKQVLAHLQQLDDFEVGTSPGPIDVSETPPTQAEIDAAAWFKQWGQLKGAQLLIDHGVITAANATYVSLKDAVITGFKAAYVNDVRFG